MGRESIKLATGSKVAIIGGGPAGSFFALYLLHYAAQRGIQPEITIYQQRSLEQPGPKGCKGCAGILSISLLSNLGELGLSLPEEIIQSRIEHYTVHSPDTSISISNPEKGVRIASIYRGGGPRLSSYDHPVSFDGWLLAEARQGGARVANQTVDQVYLEGGGARLAVAGQKLEYDLIVLASGVNAAPVPIRGLDYVPPKTQLMTQDELYVGADQIESRLGNAAHAFLVPNSGLIFGTLVPKGQFINVSVLSEEKRPVSVSDFLKYDIVRRILPEQYQRTCGCQPRAVVSSAGNYFADRLVTVGDAVVSRLYKDGIGSSLLTAREAARSAVYHGLSRRDFAGYYQPFCNRMDRDNRWGQLLFSINNRVKDSRAFILAQHRLIGDEQHRISGSRPFTKSIWGMFTGSYSYKSIVWMTASPLALVKLSLALFRESLSALFHRRAASPKRLHVGSRKVLILGSGFGGTHVLRHLVPALNQNENVVTTMVSNENFFLFSPLLHEVAMGGIETRHIAYPIRRLHLRDRFNFIQASVSKIDLGAHRVTTSRGTLEFDYLVLALGSVSDTSGLSSRGANVFTLKTLRDSMLIRNHIIEVFEQASIASEPEQQQLLTFVVSGGGYVGIQLVAELRDFIYRNLIRFYKTIDTANIRVILVEAEAKLLAGMHPKLAAYVIRHLQDTGIETRMSSRVTNVRDDGVEINDSERVPTSTLIWVTGVVASPQIAELDVSKDSIGRVLVNDYLEVPGMPGVYAVGDCVHCEDPKSGRPVPPRAHTAVRQARVVAHNILADIRGRDKKPYRYSQNAEMVSLGASKAILRFHGLRVYGFLARFIWLVGYSSLVTGTYNRTRIILDWLLSLIFGRDTTFLKLRR